jgi:hypothetical protein
LFRKFTVLRNKVDDSALWNQLPVYLYPFSKIPVMGRCIKPSFEACGCKNGGQHVGSGALSVGACNMDGWEFQLWMAQVRTKRQRVAHVFFEGRRANALEHWELRK